MTNNSGNAISLLKKQVIDQACQLKESERRMALLENHHKKMIELLQAAHAGLSQKDRHIEQLEARLKRRVEKDVTLGQSVTKVVKAIFGKRLPC